MAVTVSSDDIQSVEAVRAGRPHLKFSLIGYSSPSMICRPTISVRSRAAVQSLAF
jgi:hypothetical protein